MADTEKFETVMAERLAKNAPHGDIDVHIDTVIIMDTDFAEIVSEVKDVDDV